MAEVAAPAPVESSAPSAPPAGGPPVKVTNFESAVEAVQGILESEPGSPKEAKQAPPKSVTLEGEEAPKELPEKTPKAEQAEGEEPSAENAEAESPADSGELPDTLQGLAEHLGVEPADLAGHLKVQIKNADGTSKTITLAEAVRGHLRESDYHAKTEALAQDRRQLDAIKVQGTQAIQAKLAQLDSLTQELQAQIGNDFSDEKLMTLLNQDPTEYLRQVALRDAKTKAHQKAMEAKQLEQRQAQYEQAQRTQQYVQEQRAKLLDRMPGLKDPKEFQKWSTSMGEYLTNGAGFSFEEVSAYANGPWDHRYWALADKARKWDALQKGQSQVRTAIQDKPPVKMKPGVGSGKPGVENDHQKARQRLRKQGDVDSAVAFVKTIL